MTELQPIRNLSRGNIEEVRIQWVAFEKCPELIEQINDFLPQAGCEFETFDDHFTKEWVIRKRRP